MENWPKYYKNQLIINSEKGVAITCGWTKKEEIWENLSSESRSKVSALGQLYSKDGVNFIIRNTFLNPSVNYLIITGKDISGSIESFKDFLNSLYFVQNWVYISPSGCASLYSSHKSISVTLFFFSS